MLDKLSLKTYALLFGFALVLAGILGFIPIATPNHMLLGIFMVDPMHNVVHIVSGLLAFSAVMWDDYAKLYFRAFGVFYALVAVLGFVMNGELMMMHMNVADHILHVVIAVAALYLGFAHKQA